MTKHNCFGALLIGLLMGFVSLTTAHADDSQTNSPIQLSGTPEVTYAKVSGNTQKFREDVGMEEGWNGGVENGTLHYDLNKDTTLDGEGRFIIDEHDYKFQLQLTKKDVWYARAGYTEYRDYYDNRGGFYAPFSPSSFRPGGWKECGPPWKPASPGCWRLPWASTSGVNSAALEGPHQRKRLPSASESPPPNSAAAALI